MNWQKASVQRLQEYEMRKNAVESITEQIKTIELSISSIRAARTDVVSIEGGGNRREDAILNYIVKRNELETGLDIVKREIAITENALELLTAEERRILFLFYINRQKGHVERLEDELCIERSRVYQLKDAALKKFTIACYGVVEI